MLPERGIVSFIRMKLASGLPPQEIKGMLLRAGFHSDNIDHAFRYVKEKFSDAHQDIEASHDFLPDLSKERTGPLPVPKTNPVVRSQSVSQSSNATASQFATVKPAMYGLHAPQAAAVHSAPAPYKTSELQQSVSNPHNEKPSEMSRVFKAALTNNFKTHKGLFQGRLRRKDFTLGFLFFFAVGYVVLSLSAVLISATSPEIWSAILAVIEKDTNGILLMTIPVILAPITIMMLSLITRRLHNLGIPGSLSWLFLILFIPMDVRIFQGMWFLYIALGILFVVLLAKKGSPNENEYGAFPDSKGSFFKRIFNV